MDDDVATLVREQRLVEAAELATAHADHHTASTLFERACVWKRAAEAALAAGEPARALTLGALGDAGETAQAALDALKGTAASEVVSLAVGLAQRGQHAWAARTYEAGGAYPEAAVAWERAGDALRAARLLETAEGGQGAIAAARVLDGALRLEPERADLRLALGRLLLGCGKAAAALRVLQRVPDEAEECHDALRLSVAALTELGMSDAKAEVLAKLTALGGAPSSVDRPPEGQARAVAMTPRLYGRYEVVREVSSTATARLVECQDTLRGERVALKIFSADGPQLRGSGRDALARFMREARVLGELAHPNIVPLRDVIEQGPALVLAWMPGGTLEEHLATETFAPARAADVARSVLGALGEAHRVGVVHRDIKPANILFDAAGTARLADFGVAHLGDLSVTATAGLFGSLAYMSPEQREGRPATAQSDLFGVGVVLLEMLTGRRPRAHEKGGDAEAREPLASFHRHLDARHDAVVAALVALDPAERPIDAFTAARTIAALPWPAEPDAQRLRAPQPSPASVHPPSERIETLLPLASGANIRDLWLDRLVMRAPLTPGSLARAAVFARVGHRALQPVLRVDREGATLWLGVPPGEPLTRGLLGHEITVLERALSLLHAEGFVHGGIARGAIVVTSSGPVLLFPSGADPEHGPAVDLEALRRLSG